MASRVLGAFVVTGTAVLASLALATPAFAHNQTVKASCDETTQESSLSVDLTWYGTEKKNKLTVFIDGVEQDHKVTFGQSYKETAWESDGREAHVYKVAIKAYDDPKGTNGWTKEITLPKTEACVKAPPKPEQPKPPKPEQPKPPVETTEAPSSSVTPPAPGGSTPEPPLAATGASPMWLLLSGLGLVGAGAGTLLFLRRRRSA
ncbi:LPXTG cell wall anchor domain-containing protein [Lentzea sp. NPDC006480]|uniref:LPXTG cell wall anchor domain-containing protein n=1 Tax=Lentzea sp. NPDC006480 TaxID=3157176 RepID=UPI0033B791D0